MFTQSFVALAVLSLFSSHVSAADSPFDPRAYAKSTVTCKATNRAEGKEVDLSLSYVDINPSGKRTLLMWHGWPGLWSTWSKQIQEFKDDYRLIVPNVRGFADSAHPGDVQSSATIPDMVGDMACILEHAGVSSAVCMGHDWGGLTCYEAARSRPDLFNWPYVLVEQLAAALPRLTYQIYFKRRTNEAIAELDKDIRRSLRAVFRTHASPPPDAFLQSQTEFLGAWADVAEIPPMPFFTPEEEDYLVEQFSIQGFQYSKSAIFSPQNNESSKYDSDQNRRASWAFANAQGNHTIPQPTLSVLPTQDAVADWALASKIMKSTDYLPNLQTELMDGSHWCHIEHSETFNAIARKWLEQTFGANQGGHDEL
ncbi:Alpha/Beta hydrolase protein [Roridomyces roridus]|uniref:Alpha/Beta hydrolase protein n=1 Tax=Roridomyces roridus TaxID=1738132 RepID=A0AAD7BE99_9AGAR|nr:Alpha/Beta hydrolase protein [Roridomyces roridus]